MFGAVADYVRKFHREHPEVQNVLDVGGYNVNGSVKDIMQGVNVFATDMREGPGVDLAINGHDLLSKFEENSFDLVTCCETLEHDVLFWVTVENMRKLVKPGGWLLVTAPGVYFFEHDYPSDYYRFTEAVFRDYIFREWQEVDVWLYKDVNQLQIGDDKANRTVLGCARKPL